MTPHLSLVTEYLKAVEGMATGEALARFYAPDAVQTEFPNKVTPNGATRTVEDLLEAAERGKQVMTRQVIEVIRSYEVGNTVIVAADWTGFVSVPFGTLAVGDPMKAHFAMFFEIENGRIKRQWNYDCFEPF